ncbi:hypothetical protein JTY93_15820 [Pseudomonas hygromyciniae]|uniref:Transposase n=1 Tax=Pseudomonas hygromyciniae TaxID=2812000 RepID=A0ABX7JRR5_9PSED|nr:hypothetical protein [Pseudomonas hygromyciniae]QSB37800.1 hypothetical protein JTY93_15820 [Pseudomonas hygromyciniae]
MLAKKVCQPTVSWLMIRFREQARSHNKNAASLMFFAQNLDPERYSFRKNQLKVARWQLAPNGQVTATSPATHSTPA